MWSRAVPSGSDFLGLRPGPRGMSFLGQLSKSGTIVKTCIAAPQWRWQGVLCAQANESSFLWYLVRSPGTGNGYSSVRQPRQRSL